jgi:hypothetical protein
MTVRGLLITHLVAALFGGLLGVFWMSEAPDQPLQNDPLEQALVQIQEMRARVVSYEETKRRLDERIARLMAQKALSSQDSEVVSPADPEPPVTTDPDQDTSIVARVSLAFDDAVFLANYRSMAEEVYELIRLGDYDAALETMQYLDQVFSSRSEFASSEQLAPLYQEITEHWLPQLYARMVSEPDTMLRFCLDLRNRQRSGQKLGDLGKLLTEDHLLSLAVLGGGEISPEMSQLWLEELRGSAAGQGLGDSEIAALSYIEAPGVVELLEMSWNTGKNRKEIICTLVQIHTQESHKLLQQLVFEIEDEDLRGAVELWLQRI